MLNLKILLPIISIMRFLAEVGKSATAAKTILDDKEKSSEGEKMTNNRPKSKN